MLGADKLTDGYRPHWAQIQDPYRGKCLPISGVSPVSELARQVSCLSAPTPGLMDNRALSDAQ